MPRRPVRCGGRRGSTAAAARSPSATGWSSPHCRRAEHPGTLYALDLATGAVRWVKYLTNGSPSAPIIANQVIYFYEPGTGLVGLNPDTGDWLAVIDPACRGYNIAVADGLLYEDCYDSNGKAITTAYTPLAPG